MDTTTVPPEVRVEREAIRAALAYAAANERAEDSVVVGLVLAGMALACMLEPTTRRLLLVRYMAQAPAGADALGGWARSIDAAAQ